MLCEQRLVFIAKVGRQPHPRVITGPRQWLIGMLRAEMILRDGVEALIDVSAFLSGWMATAVSWWAFHPAWWIIYNSCATAARHILRVVPLHYTANYTTLAIFSSQSNYLYIVLNFSRKELSRFYMGLWKQYITLGVLLNGQTGCHKAAFGK